MRHIHCHKRFTWILAAAVCMMQALPLHLHLHHDDADHVAGIAHTADVHLATSLDDRAHHDDAHVIDLDANTILKSLNADAFIPLLLCVLLTLVFIPVVQLWHHIPAPAGSSPRQRYLEFAPLRAPPHA